jgi:hypothetical protein
MKHDHLLEKFLLEPDARLMWKILDAFDEAFKAFAQQKTERPPVLVLATCAMAALATKIEVITGSKEQTRDTLFDAVQITIQALNQPPPVIIIAPKP